MVTEKKPTSVDEIPNIGDNKVGMVYTSKCAATICTCGELLTHKWFVEVREGEAVNELDTNRDDIRISFCKCGNIIVRQYPQPW